MPLNRQLHYSQPTEFPGNSNMYYQPKHQVSSQVRVTSQPPSERPQNATLANSGANTRSDPQPQTAPHGADPQDSGFAMEGVYIISVAARILDMHPQTLRKYERLGLINPGRTIGMLRLYSRDDIRKVRLIRHLVNNLGMNLAGVEHTLGMVDSLLRMKHRLADYAQSRTETAHMKEVVEQELAGVFRQMNLPADDW